MEFVAIAEKMGMTQQLTRVVVRRALEYLRNCPELPSLSVNLSAQDIISRETSDALVAMILAEPESVRHRLVLEVTESSLLNDMEEARYNLMKFRFLGLKIALDDFGTGLFLVALPAGPGIRHREDRPQLWRGNQYDRPWPRPGGDHSAFVPVAVHRVYHRRDRNAASSWKSRAAPGAVWYRAISIPGRLRRSELHAYLIGEKLPGLSPAAGRRQRDVA
jgi:hypothetical protein